MISTSETRTIRAALRLLGRRSRLQLMGVMAAMALAAAAELGGLGVVLFFIQLQANPAALADNSVVRAITDNVVPLEFLTGIWGGICFGLLYVLKTAVVGGCYLIMLTFTYGEAARTGERLFKRYVWAPYTLIAARNTAELMRNANAEVSRAYTTVVTPLVLLVANLSVGLCLFVALLFLTPVVTLVAFATVGGMAALFYGFYRRLLKRRGRERQTVFKDMVLWLSQAMGAHKEVRLLGRELYFVSRYVNALRRFMRAERLMRLLSLMPRLVHESVLVIGMIVALLAFQATGQSLEAALPTLGAFAFAGVRLLGIVNSIIEQLQHINFAGSAIDVLLKEFKTFPDNESRQPAGADADGPSGSAPRGEIILEGVSFSYPGRAEQAVEDVNLTIPIGSSVAFVGPSGAGKSTVVNLLLGLIKPDQGRVLVAGADIHDNLPAWFARLGYIPQQIYLLDDTVANNVAFGLPPEKVDRARVEEVVRIAQLEEFVARQPKGIDQVVGENGVQISGGERQRVGIARALYRDPPVLVLDEATSALDNATERRFVEAIFAVSAGRTLVTIAHRISTVRNCDLIFYMEDGRLLESGSYAQLYSTSERFRLLVHSPDEGGAMELPMPEEAARSA